MEMTDELGGGGDLGGGCQTAVESWQKRGEEEGERVWAGRTNSTLLPLTSDLQELRL